MYVIRKTIKRQVKHQHTFTFGYSIHIYNLCFSGNHSLPTSFLNKILIQIHYLLMYCLFLKADTVMLSSQGVYSSKSSKTKKKKPNHQTNQPKENQHQCSKTGSEFKLTVVTFLLKIFLFW